MNITNIIFWFLVLYICYKLVTSMDISKSSKFFLFMVLSLCPIAFSFMLFDIKPLSNFDIIKLFYPQSLFIVGVFYTVIVISVKIFSYFLSDKISKNNVTNVFNIEWNKLLYICVTDILIYSIVPIFITKIQGGNIINLFWNSFFVYVSSIAILVALIIKKVKI